MKWLYYCWTSYSVVLMVTVTSLLSRGMEEGNGGSKLAQISDNWDKVYRSFCFESSDCPYWSVCHQNECHMTCSSDYDCEAVGQVCGYGICTAACMDDSTSTCDKGQVCREGMCVVDCTVTGRTCPGDQICNADGWCRTCFSHEECGDICHLGVCTESCNEEEEEGGGGRLCPSNKICYRSICRELCQNHWNCSGPNDCGAGICGSFCDEEYGNEDCQSDETCVNYVCLQTCPPKSEGPCPTVQTCMGSGECQLQCDEQGECPGPTQFCQKDEWVCVQEEYYYPDE